jgi:hypothetical protein
MKPLELVMYDKCWHDWAECPFRRRAYAKRLTDAELAAELYRQEALCRHEYWIETVRNVDGDYTDLERDAQKVMDDLVNTLYRFATHPHWDEP